MTLPRPHRRHHPLGAAVPVCAGASHVVAVPVYPLTVEEEPMSARSSGNGGISFLGMLAILFIGLKLANVITWSWWWVTAPLWGGFVVAALVVGLWLFGPTIRATFRRRGAR